MIFFGLDVIFSENHPAFRKIFFVILSLLTNIWYFGPQNMKIQIHESVLLQHKKSGSPCLGPKFKFHFSKVSKFFGVVLWSILGGSLVPLETNLAWLSANSGSLGVNSGLTSAHNGVHMGLKEHFNNKMVGALPVFLFADWWQHFCNDAWRQCLIGPNGANGLMANICYSIFGLMALPLHRDVR